MKWLANVLDRIDDALDTVEERTGKKPKRHKSLTGTDSGGLYPQGHLLEQQQQQLYVPYDPYAHLRAQPQHLDYSLGRLSDVQEASTEDLERHKRASYQGEHVTPSTDHVIREGIRPLTFNSTHSLDDHHSQTQSPPSPRPHTPVSPAPPSTDFLDEYNMLDGVIKSSPHLLSDPRRGGSSRGRAAPAEGPRSKLSYSTDSKPDVTPDKNRWGDEEPQFGPRKSHYTDDESSTHTQSPPPSPPHIYYSPATEQTYSQDEQNSPNPQDQDSYEEEEDWQQEGDISEPESDIAPSPPKHTRQPDSPPTRPQSHDSLATRQKPPPLSRDSLAPRGSVGRDVIEPEGRLPSPVRARSLAAGGTFSPSGKASLEQQLAECQAEISRLEGCQSEWEELVYDMHQQLQAAEKERERMEQTVEEQQQQQAAQREELARLGQSLQTLQALGKESEQARQHAQTEAEELRGQLMAARQQADRHKATAKTSQAAVVALELQLGQARAEVERPKKEVERLTMDVDVLRRRLEKAQAPREDGRVAELEQALALKDADLRRLQDELQAARMQQRSQPREDGRLAELEQALAMNELDQTLAMAEIEQALALKDADLRQLQDELQAARMQQRSQPHEQDGRLAELEQALALKDTDLLRLQDELQAARVQQRSQPREDTGHISELQQALASREEALAQLSSELRDAEALAASLGASVADRAAAISQLTEELRERDTLVAELRAQLAQAEGRREDPEMLQAAHEELGRLQDILDQQQAVGAGREAEIEAMDRELEGLEVQLAGAVEQMTAAVEELRAAEEELRVRDRQLAGLYAQLADRDQALATLASELRQYGNETGIRNNNDNSSLVSLTAAVKDQTALLAHQARELEARELRLVQLQEELQRAQAQAKDAGEQNGRVAQLEQWVERLRLRDRQQRALIKQLKEQLAAQPAASQQECEATARLVPIILV